LAFGKPKFTDEEIAAVTNVLRSGWIGMGPETIAFEQELAKFVGVPHVVTLNSCTSALFLSLLVSGIKPGDEVICPSLTWCSSANVALYLGAKPVFCDIDEETLCLTPETVKAKLTRKTKAVVVVHFGGRAVDVKAIQAVIPPGVAVIEDAAHAFGAQFQSGEQVGTSGNLTCFSFYANKNLSTAEGGAIALWNDELAGRLRSLRQHGMPNDAWKRFSQPKAMIAAEFLELGYKMNYTDLQACIGRVQLKRQGEFQKIRFAVAQHYCETLSAQAPSISFQADILSPKHARHLFVIRLPLEEMTLTRDEMILQLRSANIGASLHYPPLHRMSLYGSDKEHCHLPAVERMSTRIMTLPIGASMDIEDAQYVALRVIDLMRKASVVT
jgi:UDP-4-amino-4-deoxy-L-arabinose-oxoglutarate aminotransferase